MGDLASVAVPSGLLLRQSDPRGSDPPERAPLRQDRVSS
jgi:hypothetical protein